MQSELIIAFADGSYRFRLTLHGINEIQERCKAGIGKVWSRLAASRLNHLDIDAGVPNQAEFLIADIVEPIRQGLIGGGMGEVDGQEVKVTSLVANRLIDNYVFNRPLQESWSLAFAIVGALIEGYDAPDKKKVAMETEKEGSTTPTP